MKTITKKALIAAVATASVAGGVQVAVAPAANAAVNWGAIAVAGNGATGRAWDYPTRAAAERAALNSCGWRTCKVLATFANGCGAVAENRTTYRGYTGPTLRAAQNGALSLPGSRIKAWQCTTR
ncbi:MULTISPECIES: DUF4189 domain-containing protein [Tsukamurella]|uniref:DUF4189 domain-containing protein n=2 Tax=Tsukamurella TaxID=2060 RepID=A0A5C5S679_9ACTN|nr:MULTISPECIES: DUF4189 domain-containing protein [Tsukamurella]NMD55048.1 DUF4189 domain-containing protein [Tsukamurella columbiensis]TWS30078.1 DUF4189 domain-containing protein [Tsukamurella conjunctivitidis]